jgi:hypothetical protein
MGSQVDNPEGVLVALIGEIFQTKVLIEKRSSTPIIMNNLDL